MKVKQDKIPLIEQDPYLSPHYEALKHRMLHYLYLHDKIVHKHGSLKDFASGHHYFGFHPQIENGKISGWRYREWAPAAYQLYLIGDFNNWDRHSHPLERGANGNWEIFVPNLPHQSKVKIRVVTRLGDSERLPIYSRRVVQNGETHDFTCEIWHPIEAFKWSDQKFRPQKSLRVYEAHVGMSTEREAVGTYREFTEKVLPRIKDSGYNMIQLMAIMEHPYYGSFGYHVSNFFAVTSRSGTPEDLKHLIDTAHSMGIAVIMDLVHSHSVKNTREGINEFDGTDYQYFHTGGRGDHTLWDSKLFDYKKMEVIHFLLSNVRFWLEEYHVDGFRFDGITSMMYLHHGLGKDFVNYDMYFNELDSDAITYLQLANALAKEINPYSVTVAEDMSGMPGLCRPIKEGGIGFDYRLAMGIPDYWIKILKEKRDEDWNVWEIWNVLTNRRHSEKHIAYAESHDQAIVGDKTIAMWLMDSEMYYSMRVSDQNLRVDRGIALHKLIRFITLLLGGDGYLNFIGNEFGHPEWIDFPRQGNNWSYWYARRQWSLVDNPDLKYKFLGHFDKEMMSLTEKFHLLEKNAEQVYMDTDRKLMIFKKDELLFVFNFHPTESYADYPVGLDESSKYEMILSTDRIDFGGHGRHNESLPIISRPLITHGHKHSISIYVPNRTAFVLKRC